MTQRQPRNEPFCRFIFNKNNCLRKKRHGVIQFSEEMDVDNMIEKDAQKKNQKLTDNINKEISDDDHLTDFDAYSLPDSSWLKPFVDELPVKYRQALVMTEYENKNQREMADELGLSIPGAKSRVQRARKKIKELILACCHFDFDHFGNVLEYKSKKQSCGSCACKTEDKPSC